MRKRIGKSLICIFIIQIIVTSNFLIMSGKGAAIDIDPDFENSPKIDGNIDDWKNAKKNTIRLYTNGTKMGADDGIPIDLWVMQNSSDLYISIQFKWEDHKSNEFMGFVISTSKSENIEDFEDAKIIQFYDLGGGDEEIEFLDYNVDNDTFYEDSIINGIGNASLDGKEVTYELCIPANNTEAEEDKEDVFLDFGEEYAFKIIYGENDTYPDEIKKWNIVVIKINYPPIQPPPPIDWLKILAIVIFSTLFAFFGFYIYKIVILKKKVARYER